MDVCVGNGLGDVHNWVLVGSLEMCVYGTWLGVSRGLGEVHGCVRGKFIEVC